MTDQRTSEAGLRRDQLMPHMMVYNKVSGRTGMTLPDRENPRALRRCADDVVIVLVRQQRGEAMVNENVCWKLSNLMLAT